MTRLALLRHAPTAWTEAGRIQGRADPPLSRAGRTVVGRWVLPPELECFRWEMSPLARARETANLLGVAALIEPCLAEMNWGAWEGERLDELRRVHGDAMARNEGRGLDFRPPGGESPRDVQGRLAPWLARIADRGTPVAAVTHKGVIRAVYALAGGWDMRGQAPDALANESVHLFNVGAGGHPSVHRLNLELRPRRGTCR